MLAELPWISQSVSLGLDEKIDGTSWLLMRSLLHLAFYGEAKRLQIIHSRGQRKISLGKSAVSGKDQEELLCVRDGWPFECEMLIY